MSKCEPSLVRNIVNIFLNDSSEKNMLELINHSRIYGLTDIEILSLAQGLADSGEKVSLENSIKVCDISSTGGPTSLSTLICPLFLVEFGETVLKLGVPGRPAGGIDVLAQIKGYNITPNINQIYSWIQSNRYVHFIANENFTPLDAKLFKLRKENNAVAIPQLVIASLLSKKIAVGLNRIGLDIRVSDFGNFGTTLEEAKQNELCFNRVANLAGIKSQCFLTNGNLPEQPYIGRGEAILAMHKVFSGNIEPSLQNHVVQCFKMASSLVGYKSELFSYDSIREIFFNNILIQGGSIESFEEIAHSTLKEQNNYIYAEHSGVININLEVLRNAIVEVQEKSIGEFPDTCGLVLKVTTNDTMNRGDIICTFRCVTKYLTEFEIKLKTAFILLSEPAL